jgi:hypothetical protein
LPVSPCICAAFTIIPPLLLPGPPMSHFHATLSRPRYRTAATSHHSAQGKHSRSQPLLGRDRSFSYAVCRSS